MKRVLAVLAAVALVVGAVLVRRHLDDGTGGGSTGGTFRLVCGTDLAAACRRLTDGDASINLTVEDEGVTTDRLVALQGRDPGFDAWLAAGPWPGIVADDRAQVGSAGPVIGTPSATLARSPATIVAVRDRADALSGACQGAVTWACIGRFAGLPWTAAGGSATWGALKPGLAPPEGGAGLVALAQAVASELQPQGIGTDWASNDLDDPATSAWFDQLVGAAKQGGAGKQGGTGAGTPLERSLRLPGSYGVVGALEAEAGPSVATAADRANLRVIYPEPVATADVTMIPAQGGNAQGAIERVDRTRLLDALAATGWRVPGHAGADGVGGGPPLPSGDGLPAAGVLQHLRDQWDQVP